MTLYKVTVFVDNGIAAFKDYRFVFSENLAKASEHVKNHFKTSDFCDVSVLAAVPYEPREGLIIESSPY